MTAGVDDEKAQVLWLANPTLRCEMEGWEEAVVCYLRLGGFGAQRRGLVGNRPNNILINRQEDHYP